MPQTRIKPVEADLLLYLYRNSGTPFEQWPEKLQQPRHPRYLERLRVRNMVRRKDYPLRYFLTRQGFSLATQIHNIIEHRTAKPAKA